MKRDDLGGPVLAAVSRSFYLTIRLLPGELRSPIGLAYLLARISDTIADSGEASTDARLGHLAGFARMVEGGGRERLDRLQREIHAETEGERVLLAQTGPCLDWLETLPDSDRQEIRAVLKKIIHGQTLDLERFGAAHQGAVIALKTGAELEEYTYLVAGCVGEFWTRICQQHLPGYSALDPAELCRIGIRFGQGLQLVNILRDLPADLRTGRCYLPEEELVREGCTPQDLPAKPGAGRAVFQHWRTKAGEYLGDGAAYVRAIRPARLRMGCFLPWYLGVETLALLDRQPPLESPVRVKVPRKTVYGGMLCALAAAFADWPLRPRP